MPGLHSVYNALATLATASELEVSFQVVLTRRPDRMTELGWVNARMLTPESLAAQ